MQLEVEMQTSNLPLVELPALSPNSKGKGIEIIGITTGTKHLEVIYPSPDAAEEHSTLEHVPEIDLSLLADEDLSGDWWKRYDPPKELIWTEDDRYRLGEISFVDYVEKLESVLRDLQNEIAVEESTTPAAAAVMVRPESNQSDLAPEVFMDAIEVILPPHRGGSQHRPQLSVSSALPNARNTIELESPTTPASVKDSISTSSSLFSSGSRGSKRRSTPKREFATPGSLIYAPYFAPLPPSDRTVASMPISPRVEQIRRFWSKRSGESECSSCMDDHKNRKLVTLACQHKYCHGCLEMLIKTAIQDESLWPPHCCIQDIPLKAIKSTLSRKDHQAFSDKAKEYATPAADRVYCPQPSCSAWIPPIAAGKIECLQCKLVVCGTCRGAAHPAQEDCPEDFDLQATLEEGERQGWRRCFRCRTMVERTMGCNHMTCKCNAEFCYICGVVWKTCACRPDEEQHRRQARNEQEAAEQAVREREEAEVQAALAAAEAMIRREEEERARKENAARIAARRRARKEAEKRERLAELEREMHEEWLKVVREKHNHLRGELNSLHRKQREVLNERHWREREQLEVERMLSESESKKKLAADMRFLVKRQEKELDEQRISFQQQCEKLGNEQAAVEDEYWFSLQSYLKGRPNKEERQKVLMEKFNASQAEQTNALHQQQKGELIELKSRLEVQLAHLETGMTKVREVNIRLEAIKMKSLIRRQYGDIKWFKAVSAARQKKLIELEEAMNTKEGEKQKLLSERYREPAEMKS